MIQLFEYFLIKNEKMYQSIKKYIVLFKKKIFSFILTILS